MMKNQMSLILNVFLIEKLAEKGATAPLICIMSNGERAVVKYPRNNAGTVALVREWIGACIGKKIGINMPEFGICYLSVECIEQALKVGIGEENIGIENAGVSFYSVMIDATPLQMSRLIGNTPDNGYKILMYDYILNNCDRHEGNILSTPSGGVYCIDSSHIIIDKLDRSMRLTPYLERKSIESIVFYEKDMLLYDLLMGNVEYMQIEKDICNIQELIDEEYMQELVKSIPKEWVNVVGIEYINTLMDIVLLRVKNLKCAMKQILEVRDHER